MRVAIIGAGISGLSSAYYLQKATDAQIDVYEASPRPGGVITTEIRDGCVLEGGPDSFLTQKTAAIDLCRELGLGNDLVPSNDATRKTYLLHQGKLKPFPEGFFLMVPTRIRPFVTTDLISWPGKLAALADLVQFPEESDCTVWDFLSRRFGIEICEQIAEPLLSGVYGADIRRLSVKSALPQIWELQKKGSMIRSMFGKTSVQKGSLFTTLSGGMESLIDALRKSCVAVQWKFSTPVSRIEKNGKCWIVQDQSYDAVLIACSSLPQFTTPAGKQIRELTGTIRRNSAIVISVCFKDVKREGFGWLVPFRERKLILAGTYVSNKFSGRSGPDSFLMRLFIGGENANRWIDEPDEKIMEAAMIDLNRIDPIAESPLFFRICRWPNAMPEYEVGHVEKTVLIQKLAREEKNLFMTGNVFSGVGIPDCISHARSTVGNLLESKDWQ